MPDYQAADSDSRPLVDVLAEEFSEKLRRGESPSIEDYAKRYPSIKDEIRDLFPALQLMEKASPEPVSPSSSLSGKRVGDCQIIREIGQGGMGVVYEAEQESLGRRVALKVLPIAISQDQKFIERFKREARAAARLHHTNIVPVFEVGQDGETLYYAMQFIDGQSLDQVFKEVLRLKEQGDLTGQSKITQRVSGDATSSSTPAQKEKAWFRSIAQLGAAVSDALSYAHERAIIHRDVKPSNLILDLKGVVWLADFGLAKTVDSELTETGDFVGTARYMSPERFKGNADHRADIYGLGVTLYELLTLRKAFDSDDRLQLMEQIANREPMRPREIRPNIPLDLETIVLKAMDKDPRHRYQRASELTDDLRRFVNDQPIRARRATPVERMARWVRRNRALTAALVSMALAIIVLIVSTLVVLNQRDRANEGFANAEKEKAKARQNLEESQRQRQRADQESERARLEARSAREAVDQLLSTVGDVRLRNVPFMDDLRRQLLDEALKFQEEFLQRSNTRQDRTAVVNASQNVSNIHRLLGNFDKSIEVLLAARDLLIADASLDSGEPQSPANSRDTISLAEIESLLSHSYREAGKLNEAQVMALKSVERLEDLLELDRDNVDLQNGLVGAWQHLADVERFNGNQSNAEAIIRKILGLVDQLPTERQQTAEVRMHQAVSLSFLGELLYSTRRTDEAVRNFEQANQIFRNLETEYPDERIYRESFAKNANFLGAYCIRSGRLDDAAEAFRDGISRLDYLTVKYPQIPNYRSSRANMTGGLATALAIAGKSDESLKMFRATAEQSKEIARDFPNSPRFRNLAAHASRQLAVHYQNIGRPSEAVQPYRNAFDMMLELHNQFPNNVGYQMDLAELAFLHSRLPQEADDGQAALERLKYAEQSVALAEPIVKQNSDTLQFRHKLAKYYSNLAEQFSDSDRRNESEPFFQKAIEQQRFLVREVPNYEDYRRLLAISLDKLSNYYRDEGQSDKAKTSLLECLELRKLNLEKNPKRVDFSRELVETYLALGRLERELESPNESEKAFQESVRLSLQSQAAFPEFREFRLNAMLGLEELISLFQASKQEQNATQAYEKARKLAESELDRKTPDQRVVESWSRIAESVSK